MADEVRDNEGQGAEVSEAQIAVHWRSEQVYPPTAAFVAQANAAGPAIVGRFAEEDFPGCFAEYGNLLAWNEPWHTVLDTSNPPSWKRGMPRTGTSGSWAGSMM